MWQSTITCDIGTAQCDDETVKCEKKIRSANECDKSMVIFLGSKHI